MRMRELSVTRWLKQLAILMALPIILIILWQIWAWVSPSIVFPSPLESLRSIASDFGRKSYWNNVHVTVQLVLMSWAIAVGAGVLLGFVLGLSRFWSGVFETPMFAIYSMPLVTLYPVFILLLGIGAVSRVAFAVAHGLFPVALLVMGAVRDIDRNLLKLSDVLVVPWHFKIMKIIVPSLISPVVTAIRLSFGLVTIGMLLAEMISSDVGIGYELIQNVEQVRLQNIVGQVAVIVVIAIVPGLILRWLEERTTSRYQPKLLSKS